MIVLREAVLADLALERARQDVQWGGPEHDDGHGGEDWIDFIDRFLAKATAYPMDSAEWYDGILKATALGVAALEAHGRQYGGRS